MVKLNGKCLCGLVTYQYQGKVGQVVNCHCAECRQWHAAAFRTRVVGEKTGFNWQSGEESVAYYKGLSNAIKTFCKACGSNLVSFYKKDDSLVGIPLGGVEGADELKPDYHIFVKNKAKWFEIADDLPRYEELPPDKAVIHCVNRE